MVGLGSGQEEIYKMNSTTYLVDRKLDSGENLKGNANPK